MPRGHAVRREPKKAKKKDANKAVPPPVFVSVEVETTGKRRKPKEE